MFEELERCDPRAAERYADRNPRRILRALEYIAITGRPFSETWDAHRDAADVTPIYVGIDMDRDTLNARINARCDAMWRSGLIEETQRVLDMGVDPFAQSLQTVGYVEAIAVINGIMSLDDAQEKLRIATRRYAKRQRTWFRRDERIHWIDGTIGALMLCMPT
jgi:tRNA dimethylallyltransferase